LNIRVGDGSRGWADYAPFDKILVAAAAEVPPALVERSGPAAGWCRRWAARRPGTTVVDKDNGAGHAGARPGALRRLETMA
jgi:protein-L-isoaspartate(D-aspartate) O-methyltransferase